MEKEVNYNGHTYWVKIEPAIYQPTGETVFIAYVNDQRPGYLLYGKAVRGSDNRVMLFGDEITALTNANAIKQSEIDNQNV
jgi:hypothetical protein